MFGSEELVLYLGGLFTMVFNVFTYLTRIYDPWQEMPISTISKYGINDLLNKKHLLSVISTVI